MFSTGVLAAKSVPIDVGYSGTLETFSASDKSTTKRGFVAGINSDPAFEQQGTGTATLLKLGNLDDVTVTLDGTDYQIIQLCMISGATLALLILHPNQSDTVALPRNLFTTISVDNKAFNQYNTNGHGTTQLGNDSYRVTYWSWIVANPFSTTNGDDHTITFAR
tara:strand:- start:492 stop:983 length:492 start_codon:yes stop_codon:yes gene_type:complete